MKDTRLKSKGLSGEIDVSQRSQKIRDRSRADKYLIQLPEPAEESAGGILEPRSDADTAEQALVNIRRQELYAAVLKLSEEYQKIIYLKLAGYSNAEIGTIIGKSEGAVKPLYHRAMLALREDLSISDQFRIL